MFHFYGKIFELFFVRMFYIIAIIVPKSICVWNKIRISPYFTARAYKQTHIMNRVLLYDVMDSPKNPIK